MGGTIHFTQFVKRFFGSGIKDIFQNPSLLPCFNFLVRIHLFGFYISGEGVELVIVGALGELFQRKSGKKSFQRRREGDLDYFIKYKIRNLPKQLIEA